ncbi:MAG: peptidyl-prolyl cis-trans isomerase [Verrucomicrobiota bacterium]|nr:peptidyl-prolyl cis-trans isomerase [Verrucomicrobiota bacterium]
MFIAAQKLLHKHGRLFFAIIGVMIVLPFVFWGTTGVNRETEEPRGTIMGKPVLPQDFYQAYLPGTLRNFLNSGDTRGDEDALKRQAWNRMVSLRQAKALGLQASPALVDQQIKEMPFLQGPSGQFDYNAYQNFVQRITQTLRISQTDFERVFQDDLTIALLEKMVLQGANVTESEIEQLHDELFQAYDLQIFQVTTPPDDADLEPTEEQVAEYFESNQEDFRVPDQRSVAYVSIQYAAYTNTVSVTEAALTDYFERNPEKYVDEEGKELAFEAARPKVEDDLRQLLARREAYEASESFYNSMFPTTGRAAGGKGLSFEEAAAQFNLPIQTTPLFRRNGLIADLGAVPEFRSTAFTLTQDAPVSDPVAEQDAVYILKLTETTESYLPDLVEADAEGRVTSAVRSEMRDKAIQELANSLKDQLAAADPKDSATLKAQAEEAGATVREFSDITQMDAFQQLRQFPQAAMEMGSLEEGEFGEVIRGFPGYYFVTVSAVKPADPTMLAERRDQLEMILGQQIRAARYAEWNDYLMRKFQVIRFDDETFVPTEADLEAELEEVTEIES